VLFSVGGFSSVKDIVFEVSSFVCFEDAKVAFFRFLNETPEHLVAPQHKTIANLLPLADLNPDHFVKNTHYIILLKKFKPFFLNFFPSHSDIVSIF